jgi:hypothetical protein
MTRKEIRALLVATRVSFDDAAAAAEDQMNAPRDRELGPVLARRNFREAKKSVVDDLNLLIGYFSDEPEPAEAAGTAH